MWGRGSQGQCGRWGGRDVDDDSYDDDDDDDNGSSRGKREGGAGEDGGESRRGGVFRPPILVIPPIWIIKSKSVFRIHQGPHGSQITPRCADDIAAHDSARGCNPTLLYFLKSSQL